MIFDLDPFGDILPVPTGGIARAGAKFQPKAKCRPRKEKPSIVPDTTQICIDTSSIRPCSTTLADPSSKLLETQELVNSTEVSHPGVPPSDGNENSVPEDASPQLVTTKDNSSSMDNLHSEVAISNSHGELQFAFGRSRGEIVNISSELESLDDILPQPTTANVCTVRKFKPKVQVNAQSRNKISTSGPVTTDADVSISHPEALILHDSITKDLEEGPTLPVLTSVNSPTFGACSSAPSDSSPELLVFQQPVKSVEAACSDSNGNLQMDNGRKEEAEAFPGSESFDIISQTTTTNWDAQLIPSENEYLDEDSDPAFPSDGFLDFLTMRLCYSASTDPPSELSVIEELTHLADSTISDSVPGEIVDSQDFPVMSRREGTKSRKGETSTVSEDTVRKVRSSVEEFSLTAQDERPILAAIEENVAGNSSRQLRKRLIAHVLADEIENRSQENGDLLADPSDNSLMDEDDNNDDDGDEYRGEDTSHCKRAPRRSKRLAVENEKTVRRGKKASEAVDPLNQEPRKKKFSHSTRRNKRRVDKVLLETPEEEINPRKLIMKDLILLAEAKERILNKEAAASKESIPSQSGNNSFAQDALYDEEDAFAPMQGLNPDDDPATPKVQPSSSKLNYQSYMDRTPTERWSKQDTELFYKAIRQFGTDFAMIQQLFPGRTRHQVKLKYKKEERQHPLMLYDALTNRSKDHSHFELVIERLQQAAAQAEENPNREESFDMTGEEEVTPEMNEEVGKSERKRDEEVAKDLESQVPEVQSPVKSHDSEDDMYRWSQYKSDYDIF